MWHHTKIPSFSVNYSHKTSKDFKTVLNVFVLFSLSFNGTVRMLASKQFNNIVPSVLFRLVCAKHSTLLRFPG